MTFCLGIHVQDGLIGIADTRILTGQEFLTARKYSVYQGPGHAFFAMTSGLRSVRDKTLAYFDESMAEPDLELGIARRAEAGIRVNCRVDTQDTARKILLTKGIDTEANRGVFAQVIEQVF